MIHNLNKIVVSGVQPTGIIHIGNYLGAFKNFLKLQDQYQCFFFIADLHSLTTSQNPESLKEQIIDLMASFLSLGLDPKKSVLFLQSFVPPQAELSWILSCFTPLSYLKEMHQFKEKSKKQGHNINAGLFNYPILQSADILIYDADFVPVGQDQIQHIELTRDIAKRFNKTYGPLFKIPKTLINKDAPKIMSLKNPTKKMSKSDPQNSYIGVFEEPDIIKQKIKGAVTDSGSEIIFDLKNKPAISNLISIAAGILEKNVEETIKILKAKNYLTFKEKLADLIIEYFSQARQKKQKLLSDKKSLMETFLQGSKIAQNKASEKIISIKKTIGLLPF